MTEEYSFGFSYGKTKGVRDANILLNPSIKPFNSDNQEYELGYGNGYILGYTQTLIFQLKQDKSNQKKDIIVQRMIEISNCLNTQNEYINKKLVLK